MEHEFIEIAKRIYSQSASENDVNSGAVYLATMLGFIYVNRKGKTGG